MLKKWSDNVYLCLLLSDCFTSQCYNGGTCKEAVYSSDYICQCPPGFSGTRCEISKSTLSLVFLFD